MRLLLPDLKRLFRRRALRERGFDTVLGVTKDAFKTALPFCELTQVRTRFRDSYCVRLPRIRFQQSRDPLLSDPVSQLCTARQFREPIYADLCAEICEPPRFHRKQWEYVYILQVLKKYGKLQPNAAGLGFGCGREPLPAAFAKYGCCVLATDLAQEKAISKGWQQTGQYTGTQHDLYKASERIVDRQTFYDKVAYREVDMSSLPSDLCNSFDFVWSSCALEHLGSLQAGIDFILASLQCLKPGGVAVHTTEFNLSSNSDTLETAQVCLYRAQDVYRALDLLPTGYRAAMLTLNTGKSSIDRYIDVPPYLPAPHLKLLLDKYVTTSIGLVFTKDEQERKMPTQHPLSPTAVFD